MNLLAAVVPSNKIDELYYHMLLPARVVADHGLAVYRAPIEAAVLPQMAYPFFAAPLHALGYPDAPNVVSWMLSLMLVWLGWALLRQRGIAEPVAYCLVAALLVGAYPVVFHVTGGSHAFGDLSLATAVVALVVADQAPGRLRPRALRLHGVAAGVECRFREGVVAPGRRCGGAARRLVRLAGCRDRVAAASHHCRIGTALADPRRAVDGLDLRSNGLAIRPVARRLIRREPLPARGLRRFRRMLARASNRSPLDAVLFDNLAAYSPLVWLGAIGALDIRVRHRRRFADGEPPSCSGSA